MTLKKVVTGFVAGAFFFTTVGEPFAQSTFWADRQTARSHSRPNSGEGDARNLLSSISWPKESLNPILGAYRLPSSLGTVVETRVPRPGAPVLLHMQDAHGLYGAQLNASKILDGLFRAGWNGAGAVPVYQEGGAGPANLDWLSAFPFDDIKERVARVHLRQKELTGEEYRAIVSSSGTFRLLGVENQDLYKQNLAARHETAQARAAADAHIGRIQARLSAIKTKVYPPSLLKLDQPFQAYTNQTLTFIDYIRALSPDPLRAADYPNLDALLRLTKLETEMDPRALAEERDLLVRKMAASLSVDAVKDLAAKAIDVREGRLTQGDFYQALLSMATQLKRQGEDLPTRELRRYVGYLRLSDSLRHDELLVEAEQWRARLFEKYSGDDRVWRLVDTDRRVALERLLWKQEMTPDQYAAFRQAGPLDWAEVEKYIALQEASLGLSVSASAVPALLDPLAWTRSLPEVRAYYELALERDASLVKNALADMARTGAQRGVLIAGGFHTPGLTRLFRQSDVGYAVIQPRFETDEAAPSSEDLTISQAPDAFAHSVREANLATWPAPGSPLPSLKQSLTGRMALSMFSYAIKGMVQPGNKQAAEIERKLEVFAGVMKSVGIKSEIRRAVVSLDEGGKQALVLYGSFNGELFIIAQSLDERESISFVSESYASGSETSLNKKLGALLAAPSLVGTVGEGLKSFWAVLQSIRSARIPLKSEQLASLRAQALSGVQQAARAIQVPATSSAAEGQKIIDQAEGAVPVAARNFRSRLAGAVPSLVAAGKRGLVFAGKSVALMGAGIGAAHAAGGAAALTSVGLSSLMVGWMVVAMGAVVLWQSYQPAAGILGFGTKAPAVGSAPKTMPRKYDEPAAAADRRERFRGSLAKQGLSEKEIANVLGQATDWSLVERSLEGLNYAAYRETNFKGDAADINFKEMWQQARREAGSLQVRAAWTVGSFALYRFALHLFRGFYLRHPESALRYHLNIRGAGGKNYLTADQVDRLTLDEILRQQNVRSGSFAGLRHVLDRALGAARWGAEVTTVAAHLRFLTERGRLWLVSTVIVGSGISLMAAVPLLILLPGAFYLYALARYAPEKGALIPKLFGLGGTSARRAHYMRMLAIPVLGLALYALAGSFGVDFLRFNPLLQIFGLEGYLKVPVLGTFIQSFAIAGILSPLATVFIRSYARQVASVKNQRLDQSTALAPPLVEPIRFKRSEAGAMVEAEGPGTVPVLAYRPPADAGKGEARLWSWDGAAVIRYLESLQNTPSLSPADAGQAIAKIGAVLLHDASLNRVYGRVLRGTELQKLQIRKLLEGLEARAGPMLEKDAKTVLQSLRTEGRASRRQVFQDPRFWRQVLPSGWFSMWFVNTEVSAVLAQGAWFDSWLSRFASALSPQPVEIHFVEQLFQPIEGAHPQDGHGVARTGWRLYGPDDFMGQFAERWGGMLGVFNHLASTVQNAIESIPGVGDWYFQVRYLPEIVEAQRTPSVMDRATSHGEAVQFVRARAKAVHAFEAKNGPIVPHTLELTRGPKPLLEQVLDWFIPSARADEPGATMVVALAAPTPPPESASPPVSSVPAIESSEAPSVSRSWVVATRSSGLNVRGAPGKDAPWVASLAKGDPVTVFERSGDWARIGEGKWVSVRFLAPADPVERVAAQVRRAVESRATPNLSSELKASAANLARVPIGGEFGAPRVNDLGEGYAHAGVDVPVPMGTPIRAPEPMRVVRVGDFGARAGYGLELRDRAGYSYRFFHTSDQFPYKAGEELPAGAIVGTTGDSGDAQGHPHAHVEVRGPTGLLNPMLARLSPLDFLAEKEKPILLAVNDSVAPGDAHFSIGGVGADAAERVDLKTVMEQSDRSASVRLKDLDAKKSRVVVDELLSRYFVLDFNVLAQEARSRGKSPQEIANDSGTRAEFLARLQMADSDQATQRKAGVYAAKQLEIAADLYRLDLTIKTAQELLDINDTEKTIARIEKERAVLQAFREDLEQKRIPERIEHPKVLAELTQDIRTLEGDLEDAQSKRRSQTFDLARRLALPSPDETRFDLGPGPAAEAALRALVETKVGERSMRVRQIADLKVEQMKAAVPDQFRKDSTLSGVVSLAKLLGNKVTLGAGLVVEFLARATLSDPEREAVREASVWAYVRAVIQAEEVRNNETRKARESALQVVSTSMRSENLRRETAELEKKNQAMAARMLQGLSPARDRLDLLRESSKATRDLAKAEREEARQKVEALSFAAPYRPAVLTESDRAAAGSRALESIFAVLLDLPGTLLRAIASDDAKLDALRKEKLDRILPPGERTPFSVKNGTADELFPFMQSRNPTLRQGKAYVEEQESKRAAQAAAGDPKVGLYFRWLSGADQAKDLGRLGRFSVGLTVAFTLHDPAALLKGSLAEMELDKAKFAVAQAEQEGYSSLADLLHDLSRELAKRPQVEAERRAAEKRLLNAEGFEVYGQNRLREIAKVRFELARLEDEKINIDTRVRSLKGRIKDLVGGTSRDIVAFEDNFSTEGLKKQIEARRFDRSVEITARGAELTESGRRDLEDLGAGIPKVREYVAALLSLSRETSSTDAGLLILIQNHLERMEETRISVQKNPIEGLQALSEHSVRLSATIASLTPALKWKTAEGFALRQMADAWDKTFMGRFDPFISQRIALKSAEGHQLQSVIDNEMEPLKLNIDFITLFAAGGQGGKALTNAFRDEIATALPLPAKVMEGLFSPFHQLYSALFDSKSPDKDKGFQGVVRELIPYLKSKEARAAAIETNTRKALEDLETARQREMEWLNLRDATIAYVQALRRISAVMEERVKNGLPPLREFASLAEENRYYFEETNHLGDLRRTREVRGELERVEKELLFLGVDPDALPAVPKADRTKELSISAGSEGARKAFETRLAKLREGTEASRLKYIEASSYLGRMRTTFETRGPNPVLSADLFSRGNSLTGRAVDAERARLGAAQAATDLIADTQAARIQKQGGDYTQAWVQSLLYDMMANVSRDRLGRAAGAKGEDIDVSIAQLQESALREQAEKARAAVLAEKKNLASTLGETQVDYLLGRVPGVRQTIKAIEEIAQTTEGPRGRPDFSPIVQNLRRQQESLNFEAAELRTKQWIPDMKIEVELPEGETLLRLTLSSRLIGGDAGPRIKIIGLEGEQVRLLEEEAVFNIESFAQQYKKDLEGVLLRLNRVEEQLKELLAGGQSLDVLVREYKKGGIQSAPVIAKIAEAVRLTTERSYLVMRTGLLYLTFSQQMAAYNVRMPTLREHLDTMGFPSEGSGTDSLLNDLQSMSTSNRDGVSAIPADWTLARKLTPVRNEPTVPVVNAIGARTVNFISTPADPRGHSVPVDHLKFTGPGEIKKTTDDALAKTRIRATDDHLLNADEVALVLKDGLDLYRSPEALKEYAWMAPLVYNRFKDITDPRDLPTFLSIPLEAAYNKRFPHHSTLMADAEVGRQSNRNFVAEFYVLPFFYAMWLEGERARGKVLPGQERGWLKARLAIDEKQIRLGIRERHGDRSITPAERKEHILWQKDITDTMSLALLRKFPEGERTEIRAAIQRSLNKSFPAIAKLNGMNGDGSSPESFLYGDIHTERLTSAFVAYAWPTDWIPRRWSPSWTW
ncbi:MAG: peptidoglycan DD-metalloendopeptidase family protein [Elusimicrobia bacterium]|nr:peptidoglycan DD-metalloendopeptidase family protein [Elusimicrobiota bacterium]